MGLYNAMTEIQFQCNAVNIVGVIYNEKLFHYINAHIYAHTHTDLWYLITFLFCQFVFMSVKNTLYNMSRSWENGFRALSAILKKVLNWLFIMKSFPFLLKVIICSSAP